MTNLQEELQARGAVLRGHFQLASGRHADTYIEKFRILQWPDITGQMCQQIADHFRGQPNLGAGPTTGGIILSYETARHLGARSIGISGGVSANSRLRRDAAARGEREGIPVYVPALSLSTDNAAMIAAAGLRRLERGEQSGLDFNAHASLPIQPAAGPQA